MADDSDSRSREPAGIGQLTERYRVVFQIIKKGRKASASMQRI